MLPSFLSVVFDPTLRKLGNIELMGHYLYDDEGVKARRVTVVDKGILKTFLARTARRVAGFAQSNGHGRAEAGLRAGVAPVESVVESSQTRVDRDADGHAAGRSAQAGQAVRPALRQHRGRLHHHGPRHPPTRSTCCRTSCIGSTRTVAPPELVRGVDLIGTPLAAFAKDRRDRRQGGRVQRRLRRRERRRARCRRRRRRCSSARSRCRRRRSRRSRCRFCRRRSREGSPDMRADCSPRSPARPACSCSSLVAVAAARRSRRSCRRCATS